MMKGVIVLNFKAALLFLKYKNTKKKMIILTNHYYFKKPNSNNDGIMSDLSVFPIKYLKFVSLADFNSSILLKKVRVI